MALGADKYKQTELVVIPSDWEVKELGSISTVSSGGTPNRGVASYWNGNIPWITTSQIDFNTIDDANEFITEEGLINSAAKIYKAGTLLMAMYGQGKTRGKVAILGIEATTNQACGAIILVKDVLKEYIFCNLSGRYDEIRNLSNTGNQENLNGELIKKILIPLPPTLAEQTLIATALSDADTLICSLEKLIAKKRNIKQGAMQELLKPKEGWEVRKLGEVLTFGSGRDYKNLSQGEIPVYGTGGVMTYVNEFLFDGESVGIGRKGTIDKPIFLNGKFWTVDTLFFTHQFINSSPKFMFYKFCLIKWKEYNEASGVPSLNKKTLENIEISIPSFLEQTRIATILSDMDAEIGGLETKLEKYKQVKLGMMQELLTGKIRLV